MYIPRRNDHLFILLIKSQGMPINTFLTVTSLLKKKQKHSDCSNITVHVCRGPKHHRPAHTPHNYSNKACVSLSLWLITYIYNTDSHTSSCFTIKIAATCSHWQSLILTVKDD